VVLKLLFPLNSKKILTPFEKMGVLGVLCEVKKVAGDFIK